MADLLRRDELVMSVLHSQLAPIYITERLGTSQQMLIDALATGCAWPSERAASAPATRSRWPPWCC